MAYTKEPDEQGRSVLDSPGFSGESSDGYAKRNFRVTGDQVSAISFAPKTLAEEVLQNIGMILSTPQYTVPLDRRFGLSSRFLDKPLAVAQALIVSEVLDAVERYEPRAEILNVSFEQSELEGRLLPVVEVNINAG